jgi:hypothetical protein
MTGNVLARVRQLGDRVNGHPEHVAEAVPELLVLLEEESDPIVIASIVEALGLAWDEEANLRLLPLVDHPDSNVRLAVARALPGGVESFAAVAEVAETLIRLSRDEVDEVRNWATFGIGSQLCIDSLELREALVLRTADTAENVRDEALIGLARRRDQRALPLVERRLVDRNASRLVFQAAEYLANPALMDSLGAWIDEYPDDDDIHRAHRACDPTEQAARIVRHVELLAAVQNLLVAQDPQRGAAIYCDRFDTDVVLSIDDAPRHVWNVDGLLERAGQNIAEAARIVVLFDRERV